MSVYYVFDWDEDKTNIPHFRGDVPLTTPHLESPDPMEAGQ